MKIGDKFCRVEITYSVCCDECNDIVENYFVCCPVCKENTTIYDSYGELDNFTKDITCENCKTVFKNDSDTWYWDNELEIISLEEKWVTKDEN